SIVKVFLVGPYPHDVMKAEVDYLRQSGFEVPAYETFECMTSEANRALSSEWIANRILQHRNIADGCDGVFVSCTNLLVMDQIEMLEALLGKPVVTSNQATLWSALRKMGVGSRHVSGGRLFEEHGVD